VSLFDQIARRHYSNPPEGWETRKIKFLTTIQTSNVDKLSNDDEVPVRLCNYTDVYYNDHITPALPFMEATATPKEIEKFALKAGQVFITKDSEEWDDIGIPALVTEDMPGVLCGYHLAIFTPEPERLNGAFLAWLCRADALNDQFKLSANGVTRFGLGHYAMKNAVIGFPPLETQKRIAAFLDEKTAQIDGLIEKKQALLDRLAEKRQAIITQAVTKGLNPAVPMKDSGIDWLGRVPAHWEVLSFRRSIRGIEQGWSPQCEERQKADDEWGVLRSGCVNEGLFRPSDHKVLPSDIDPRPELEVRVGDLLMCRASGSLHLIGSAAIVYECPPKLMFSDKTYRVLLQLDVAAPEFVALALKAKYMREQIILSVSGAGGLANNIPQSLVRSYVFVRPPLSEQSEIVSRVGGELASLAQTEAQITMSIAHLAEYRSALITSAVTGQIEGLR
jgi:type I restriction enzyme S subunit